MTSPFYFAALPDRGGIDVTGSERVRWLDGMVTQDVAGIPTGGAAPAFVLTHQGRIVSDVWIWAFEDRLHLDLERAAVAPVITHLDRFIIADDVTLTDTSGRLARWTLEGAGAARALAEALGGDPADDFSGGERDVGGFPVTIVAHGLIEASGAQLMAPAEAREAVDAALSSTGAAAWTAADFEARRIERGIPWYGKELDPSVLPAEVRQDRAISTTKGCYAGQEVVARMRSRARVANLLVALHFDSAGALPEAGSELTIEGRKVGELTSVAPRPGAAGLGLGYVKAAHAEPGTEVDVGGARARVGEPGAA